MPEVKPLFVGPDIRHCIECDMKYGPDWENSSCVCGSKLVSKEAKIKAAIKAAKERK
jgi:hypothetical protein